MGDDYTPRPGFDRWVCAGGNKEPKVNSPMNIDGKTVQTEGHVTDVLTDETIKFIKNYGNKNKPFCISLFHKAVHGPYKPAERNKDLYKNEPIVRTISATSPVVGKPALVGKNGQPPESDEAIRNQLRMVVDIDEGVGRILKTLEEAKILDNTLIVFTSDNGYLWGEHGQGQKRLAYEESIKVPMLVRYPALVKAGSVSEASILNIDFAPTFLDLANVPIHAQMKGQSILPVLKGKALKNREALLFEYYIEPTGIPSWKAVRTDRYKYINYPDLKDCNELYDLKKDPVEMHNLIKQPDAAAMVKKMESELQRLVAEFK
jgi:N-acetylglucosamine-6-sulfatase